MFRPLSSAAILLLVSATHAHSASPDPALAVGRAQATAIACPSESSADSTCLRLVIGCPSIAGADAMLRVRRPSASFENRGTIVLTSGGEGTALPSTESRFGPAMVAAFTSLGLIAVEIAWTPPGIWGGPRARTLACRYATAVNWIHEHIHVAGKAALFAAQGSSGGAAQIAFGLAHYGLSTLVDLANLAGGPPGCPRCAPDARNAPEPLLPAGPPAINHEPVLTYPTTTVRFFLG